MRLIPLAGLILIAAGIAGLAVGHFSYVTHHKVIDMGPVSASVAQQHDVSIPDIAGFGAIAAGVVLIALGRRRA